MVKVLGRTQHAVGASLGAGAGALVRGVREAVVIVVRLRAAVRIFEGVIVFGDAPAVLRGAGESTGRVEAQVPAIRAGARKSRLARVADAVRVVVRIGTAVGVLEAVEVLVESRAGVFAEKDVYVAGGIAAVGRAVRGTGSHRQVGYAVIVEITGG